MYTDWVGCECPIVVGVAAATAITQPHVQISIVQHLSFTGNTDIEQLVFVVDFDDDIAENRIINPNRIVGEEQYHVLPLSA